VVDDIQNSDDTASVFDDLAEKSVVDPAVEAGLTVETGDSAEASTVVDDQTAAAKAPSPSPAANHAKVDKIDQIKLEIHSVSRHIRDLEMLVLARVFHKIHPSYYRSWTSDIRESFNLVTRLNRRIREIRDKRAGKLPQDYRTG
jgi:hypothetical protein